MSRWKKSQASSPSAWARRNARHEVSLSRGAGPIAVAAQDLPHGRLTDPVAQADEFTVHAAISPPWVLSGESADQLADLTIW